jgi:hypothetical protein
MSSFYDDASLVVIPSGYKTSKVYAEKPTDGSGDLTFTRTGDTATRVNSAGLIEKVRTNINTYSEQLDNAAWTKQSTTVTANATTAPNNTLTADKLIATATTAFHGIFNVNATLSSLHTFSFYAKKAEYNFVTALDQFSGTFLASFNLDTGVVSSGSGASIQSVGNGWYRCAISFDGAASAVVATLAPSPSSASVNYLGDGTSGIFVWGVQLETGDIATDYIPTTTAAVSVGPVANVPRLDYLGSTCPRLILEPQRQNLVTFSEQINTGFITAQGGTGLLPVITANNAISPDGYQNADTIVFNAGAGTTASDQSAIYQVFGGTTATYTCSFYAKTPSGTAQIQVRIDGGNYEKFTITNEWQRFTLTRALTGTSNALDFVIRRGLNEPMNASATIQLWGCQVELGAYATSYIPTLAASATRGADACSKTGISSLIGQTEGTLFGEFTFTGVTPLMHLFCSVAGSYANAIYVQTFSSTGISMQVWSGAVNQVGIDLSGLSVGQNIKFAAAYKNNDFVFYVNGTQAGSDTSGTVPSGLSQIEVGGYSEAGSPFIWSSSTKQALLFKTRLTNAELASLTSL